jgi:hypothetical protein
MLIVGTAPATATQEVRLTVNWPADSFFAGVAPERRPSKNRTDFGLATEQRFA